MTDVGFSLRALVTEVAETSDSPDPMVIVKEVDRRISETQRDAALWQALPVYVQNHISRPPRFTGAPDSHTSLDTQAQLAAGGGHSTTKVTGIRETWRTQMLRTRIAVGPGTWKFFGDCGATDLGFAAKIRENHARNNAARAKQLRELAHQLTEHGVTTVSGLPDDVLSRVFGEDL